MSNVTYNLRRFILTLKQLETSVSPTAFMQALGQTKHTFSTVLWQNAEAAMNRTKEYNGAEFKEPMKAACFHEDTITIKLDGLDQIRVIIDLDATAGNIKDYANAVKKARAKVVGKQQATRLQASAYWKYFIYGQAKEGRKIKKPRKKGQRGRTPLATKDGKEMYRATINERLAAVNLLAPFWSLIDKGNTSVPELDTGGRAYPVLLRTNFVSKTQQDIQGRFKQVWNEKKRNLLQRLEREQYGENGLLEKIERAISQFESSDTTWTPGAILTELKNGEREYKVYVTKTHKLGLRLK